VVFFEGDEVEVKRERKDGEEQRVSIERKLLLSGVKRCVLGRNRRASDYLQEGQRDRQTFELTVEMRVCLFSLGVVHTVNGAEVLQESEGPYDWMRSLFAESSNI
jgi:hypothetical protein